MGLKVLGPDINESQNGFAVNDKGEIRFGFSGLKGVGEKAIEDIIIERNKHGKFKDIFDLAKRVNQKSVNKKSLESLAYSGAFDCFREFHRAQYFYQPPGDITGLEKITKFGSVFQSQSANTTNTLFGDLQMPEIAPPRLSVCEPWPLIQQLDFEKEVTGMYMSGHPLDNYKFELKHYNISALADYVEYKNSIGTISNPGRSFRVAGLVTDGQHRLTKTGKNFGIITIEDFSGKAEFFLWSEDYVRYNHYLEKGMIILIEGSFKPRYNSDQYEFRLSKIHLLDTVKTTLTKQVTIDVQPQFINADFINFIDKNIRNHPGSTKIKFNIKDNRADINISMVTLEKGFTMNDEMAVFLNENTDVEVSVVTG